MAPQIWAVSPRRYNLLRKFFQDAGPIQTDEYDAGWAALAFPRPSDHPQGGGWEGRPGLGSHLRPRVREGLPWTLPAVRAADTLQWAWFCPTDRPSPASSLITPANKYYNFYSVCVWISIFYFFIDVSIIKLNQNMYMYILMLSVDNKAKFSMHSWKHTNWRRNNLNKPLSENGYFLFTNFI